MKKRIGTAVPLAALRSSAAPLIREKHGTFATAAVFLDWLRRSRQSVWQILPLAQTHLEPGSRTRHVPSPYKGYGIGIDPRYLAPPWSVTEPTQEQRAHFLAEHGAWLPDYALFCALRDRFGTDDWTAWKRDIRLREPKAVARWKTRLADEVQAHADDQWRLHAALADLRGRAKRAGIRLIGDMPFYVPLQSPLVWAHRDCFDLRADGSMRRVSGIPEGPKSHFGRQVWGHPLYRWGKPRRDRLITDLWRLRLDHIARLYDAIRLDHAKGFYSFGSMDAKDPERDEVKLGPGTEVLEELIHACRAYGLVLFAEDSGDRLRELRRTLRTHRVSGVRILRFGYNERRKKLERGYADVSRYPRNAFAYTSSHDTVTLMGYVRLLSPAERRIVAEAVGVPYSRSDRAFALSLRRAVLDSPAQTVIIALQDWLLATDRINVPGTEKAVGDRNWRYRMPVPIEKLPTKLF